MNKTISFRDLLSEIKDTRRKQGKRHSLSDVFIIVLLSILSGCHGYRGMEDFLFRYKEDLETILNNPKHGIPSSSTLRRIILRTDFNELAQQLNIWIRSKAKIKKGEWMQVDGKGIKGTVQDHDNKHQNFINLVSLFMSRMGITMEVMQMNNKKQSEITTLQDLIKTIQVKDIIITADAIHCQKKRLR